MNAPKSSLEFKYPLSTLRENNFFIIWLYSFSNFNASLLALISSLKKQYDFNDKLQYISILEKIILYIQNYNSSYISL